VVLLLVAALVVAGSREATSLYPVGHSSVEELEPDALDQLKSHAADSRYTSIVEFYAPWCPHCQQFAPKYELVGEHFVGDTWVRVAAVDCVASRSVCGENGVKSYPTVKVYHAPGEAKSLEREGFVLKAKDLKNGFETESVIQWIEAHLEPPMIAPPPPQNPELEQGAFATAAAAVAEPQTHHSWGGSASSSSGGDTGAADALHDGSKAHEPLRPLALMLGHQGQRWSPWSGPDASHSPARKRLGDAAASLLFGLHYGVFVEGDTLSASQREALTAVLRVLSKAFPGPQVNRDALAQLLARVDDGGSGSGSGSGSGGGGGAGGALSTDAEWEAFLSDWRLAGKVSTARDLDWSANCDPSKRPPEALAPASAGGGGSSAASGGAAAAADSGGEGRHITVGYTCGLWTLFHMLTFAAPRAGLSPLEGTGAIRTYVEHFFGCSHCRDHFLTLYDACEYGRCAEGVDGNAKLSKEALQKRRRQRRPAAVGTRQAGPAVEGGAQEESEAEAFDTAHKHAALWLWRAHNAVNLRVAHDALQDEALVRREEARRRRRHKREALAARAAAVGDGPGLREEDELEAEDAEEVEVKVVDLDPSWALWPPPDLCPKCWVKGQPSARLPRGVAGEGQKEAGEGQMKEGGSGESEGSGQKGGNYGARKPQNSGGGQDREAAEFDEEEVWAFLQRAYDAGLWERSSLAALAEEAGDAKARLQHGVASFSRGEASWLWYACTILAPVVFCVATGMLKRRRLSRSGAHKKVEEDYCKMT